MAEIQFSYRWTVISLQDKKVSLSAAAQNPTDAKTKVNYCMQELRKQGYTGQLCGSIVRSMDVVGTVGTTTRCIESWTCE